MQGERLIRADLSSVLPTSQFMEVSTTLAPVHEKRQRTARLSQGTSQVEQEFVEQEACVLEQMSVCSMRCQVCPEESSHRHEGPKGVTKDVEEAPLRLGEPQRGS